MLKIPPRVFRGGIFSFQSLFQGRRAQGGQVHPLEAVFRGDDEAFGQVITGHHLALGFRLVQEFPGPPGSGGVVHVEDADDVFASDGHIIANVQVHRIPPVGEGH